MTPSRLLQTAIIPAFSELESAGIKDSFEARRMLLAMALQESGLKHRRQVVGGSESGPAVSFWQFERGGGCRGVLNHPATKQKAIKFCHDYRIEPSESGLWEAMRYQDIVAAAMARLLLYTLPNPLPQTAEQGWSQYVEAWRPGKPHPDKWAGHWETAEQTVKEST